MDFRPVPARQFIHSLIGMGRKDIYHDEVRKEDFIPVMRDDLGYLMQAENDVERKIFLTHREIYAALDTNRAVIKYGYNSVSQQALRAAFGDEKFEDRPEKDQTIALWREKMLGMFDVECEALGKRLPFTEAALKSRLIAYRKAILHEMIDLGDEDEDEDNGQSEGRKKIAGDADKNSTAAPRADKLQLLKCFPVPTAKTFKRWYDRYYGNDMDVMALLPRHHGPGPKLFTYKPPAVAFAHKMATGYLDRARPTKAHTYRTYLAALKEHNDGHPPHRQIDKVSRKKFEVMISKFDAFHVAAARFGEKFAVRKFMAIRRSFSVVAPGQRIEMDFWNVDLISLLVETGIWNILPPEIQEKIPRKRIYFGAAIDVATRYILAFKASLTPNGASAVATIRMIMSDKRHLSTYVNAQTAWVGKLRPWFISHDNGAEFIAKATQGVLRRGRIRATRPPAGQPTCRPFIERLFHTIGMLIAPYFDGRTFHNVVAKGDYDPQKHATLLVEELIKIFIFAICDIYHNKPHEGLGGNTPHNAWVEACKEYEVHYPPAPTEMLHIFGTKTTRRIGPYGVTWMGINFDHPELQRMRAKDGEVDVFIKFDPECAAHIAFKSDKGWLIARNTVDLDDSVSLAEWIAARNELRSHFATAAETGLNVMYDAINRLRAVGMAATLRAGLSPRLPTAADYAKWETELFSTWNVVASDDTPALIQEGPLTDDPLHLNTVVNRPELFSKDKMEIEQSEQEAFQDDDSDELPDAPVSTTSFDLYNEEY
ncbi:integrase catalytic domain-containing protein [Neorhizobium huautlense]|uniref:integrase catalytic domain-containing protein n=1 Tax=Neorhizobium huautlense TaxID=67774 RepID=UPI000CF9F146|nr:DDE-type integrase/transposase/recombinase [Neorhizobium huautlense]